jgi:hypothetical protein
MCDPRAIHGTRELDRRAIEGHLLSGVAPSTPLKGSGCYMLVALAAEPERWRISRRRRPLTRNAVIQHETFDRRSAERKSIARYPSWSQPVNATPVVIQLDLEAEVLCGSDIGSRAPADC